MRSRRKRGCEKRNKRGYRQSDAFRILKRSRGVARQRSRIEQGTYWEGRPDTQLRQRRDMGNTAFVWGRKPTCRPLARFAQQTKAVHVLGGYSHTLSIRTPLLKSCLPVSLRKQQSPGPMTATVNVNAQPPGPKYSMAGAPWRKKTKAPKSPGPGAQGCVCVRGSTAVEQRPNGRTSTEVNLWMRKVD